MRVTQLASPIAHLLGPGKLRIINGQLAYGQDQAGCIRLRPESLRYVFCYGDVTVTGEAIRMLFQRRVELAWLTPGGFRCAGRVASVNPDSGLLRLRQYHALSDARWCRNRAASLVSRKIAQMLEAARHYQRHQNPETKQLIRQLTQLQRKVESTPPIESLRGLEGTASAAWFRLFASRLQSPWQFSGRRRRPPPDPINALLSLGYTWLLRQVEARIQATGLELTFGTLHAYRPGRPSLACDLMEPHRVPVVDRWVLRICNQKRITPADFDSSPQGVALKRDRFAAILTDWQEWWNQGKHEEKVLATVRDYIRRLNEISPPFLQADEFESAAGSDTFETEEVS
ncbi:CRISPR-associated endonuclease Cas1 [Thermopirellula anaerolimosa]